MEGIINTARTPLEELADLNSLARDLNALPHKQQDAAVMICNSFIAGLKAAGGLSQAL